jgi:DNA-binding phage protein
MTTPFKTTPDQVFALASIMLEMKSAGLDHEFIVNASELARTDQGIYDLMALWLGAAADPAERDEIVADIQESMDDYTDAPQDPVHKPYIKYDRLEDIAKRVMIEKAKLRQIIDRHGGVSAVAQKSGIPQPSLSRMLNSPSIPRRSTLYKIANALGLSEEDIVMEWSR